MLLHVCVLASSIAVCCLFVSCVLLVVYCVLCVVCWLSVVRRVLLVDCVRCVVFVASLSFLGC